MDIYKTRINLSLNIFLQLLRDSWIEENVNDLNDFVYDYISFYNKVYKYRFSSTFPFIKKTNIINKKNFNNFVNTRKYKYVCPNYLQFAVDRLKLLNEVFNGEMVDIFLSSDDLLLILNPIDWKNIKREQFRNEEMNAFLYYMILK